MLPFRPGVMYQISTLSKRTGSHSFTSSVSSCCFRPSFFKTILIWCLLTRVVNISPRLFGLAEKAMSTFFKERCFVDLCLNNEPVATLAGIIAPQNSFAFSIESFFVQLKCFQN